MIKSIEVKSIENLITKVRHVQARWGENTIVWFRGEPANARKPLLPRLYRKTRNIPPNYENYLLQRFRQKAPSLGLMSTPPRGHTDEWLFLAQHMGLPTRLLDWSEGLFIALYFALMEKKPGLWMLNPLSLNHQSSSAGLTVKPKVRSAEHSKEFPLTWFDPASVVSTKLDLNLAVQTILAASNPNVKEVKQEINIGNANVRGAWESDNQRIQTQIPVAIYPTYSHPRMSSQKSCFTIHGSRRESLSSMVDSNVLAKFVIPSENVNSFRRDLFIFGVTRTSIFPDLDSLAKDLAR